MRWRASGLAPMGLVVLALVTPCHAELSARALAPALGQLPDGGERFLSAAQGWSGSHPRASWIVESSSMADARQAGFVPITETLAVAHASLNALSTQSLVPQAFLASLRFLQMDIASREVRLFEVVDDWGLRGEGTIVGVVDTGADPAHAALQNPDGTTRIAWMLAFDQDPRGVYPELEESYGCTSIDDPCAVYARDDIDALLAANEQEQFPQDRIGHGTHLASLAAGRDDDFPGIAPRADLVIVSASSPEGGVTDSRILIGTKFVFDRAEEMKQPAVVNVSLGSSFGAHDGSSSLEKGLSELAEGPGRAVVVASGNSGSLLSFDSANYPGPFGTHAEVTVPSTAPVSVPLLHPSTGSATTFGSIFVWITTFEDDELSLAFRNDRGAETSFVAPGESGALTASDLNDPDDYDVLLLNSVDELGAGVEAGSLVFALGGSWKTGRTFELVLKGRGTANIWATGPRGDLSTLLPRARRQGTAAIPGTGPDLITVGATINRNAWEDWEGNLVGSPTHESGLASFSALGPNQEGDLKPELLAPGAGVIGAMAQAADPRQGTNRVSQFASAGACPDETECFVIDDEHGIAMGTSMATPIVAGAAALLFQRQPELTMQEVKRLLMAGANPLSGNTQVGGMGTGQLDIARSLLAQDAAFAAAAETDPPKKLNAQKSTLSWADSFVHPSPAPPLSGYVLLRDIDGNPVVVDPEALEVSVSGPGHAEARIVGAGLARVELHAESGTGSDELSVAVRVDGQLIETSTVPVALDPQLAAGLYEFSGGNCAAAPSSPSQQAAPFWALLLLVALHRRVRPALRSRINTAHR